MPCWRSQTWTTEAHLEVAGIGSWHISQLLLMLYCNHVYTVRMLGLPLVDFENLKM
ncbi:hypothetical protein SCLCIDRAFT_165821 [Scleroderma citrinum Foug A]|uniref:Uncharacterized protein n=1 Tax=Scleroderma citrinum Foug A TaxID=1036808 RepID=A0A0C3AAD6_9AGAM|nr:hypothetical protein SCLCIDRAFT_165821 [Scleroderma citrinum Foug A]